MTSGRPPKWTYDPPPPPWYRSGECGVYCGLLVLFVLGMALASLIH